MTFQTEFIIIERDELTDLVSKLCEDNQRFVQILAVQTDAGADLIYSFMNGDVLTNYEIKGVTKDDVIPSITEYYFEAFVFENEIHDLFGVTIEDIAIDFAGKFYCLSIDEPMTILSPEKLAEREKARKAAARAAKAQKEKAAKESSEDAELEAKLASMDPAKAEKVRAALAAKQAREKAAQTKTSGGEESINE